MTYEWPERSIAYYRHEGSEGLKLVVAQPDGGPCIVIPISAETVIRLTADGAGFLPAMLRERAADSA